MTDSAPRWQFKLSDLLVACSLVAVFFAVFTSLPPDLLERDEDRVYPALSLAVWTGCVIHQLRKGNLWRRPKSVGWLLILPILTAALYVTLTTINPYDFDLSMMMVFIAIGAFGGIVLCWVYRRPNRP